MQLCAPKKYILSMENRRIKRIKDICKELLKEIDSLEEEILKKDESETVYIPESVIQDLERFVGK